MIINVGTKNPQKIAAVEEVMQEYDGLRASSIRSIQAESGVPSQPKTLDEMILGAQNRARNAFLDCHISIGIESGIMPAHGTITRYLGPCCATIYDGKEFYTGLGPAFEYPSEVIRHVETGLEIDEAFHKDGLTDNPRIGKADGVIGMLTKGRLTRKEYTKQAVVMAIVHLENPTLY